MIPSIKPPPYAEYLQAIIDSGVKIVETAGNNPVDFIGRMKDAGITIVHKCTSVRHAQSAVRNGVDMISIDGFECAGHPGEDDVPGLVLIPLAVRQLQVPVIASGGIADGRGMAAALALGAEGINMGTRFCATQEAPIHDNIKALYLANDERGTDLIFRNLKNTARVGRNGVSEEVARRLAQPGAVFEDVRELVSGTRGAAMLHSGDAEGGIFWAGMVQGLIHDIPTCQELVSRIMDEAQTIITGRLAAFAG